MPKIKFILLPLLVIGCGTSDREQTPHAVIFAAASLRDVAGVMSIPLVVRTARIAVAVGFAAIITAELLGRPLEGGGR